MAGTKFGKLPNQVPAKNW